MVFQLCQVSARANCIPTHCSLVATLVVPWGTQHTSLLHHEFGMKKDMFEVLEDLHMMAEERFETGSEHCLSLAGPCLSMLNSKECSRRKMNSPSP